MAESVVNQPPTKRRKVCEHCGKDIITLKIYKEHRRLFYNQRNKAWVKYQEEAVSSSEISSIDEIDLAQEQGCHENNAIGSGSDIEWDHNSLEECEERGCEKIPAEGIGSRCCFTKVHASRVREMYQYF